MSEINTDSQSFSDMLDESLTTLKNGDRVKGTIVRVTATEVIVDLGYKSDGIITKSEYTDDASAILTEIAKPGDIVEVFVVRVNDGDGNVLVSKRKIDSQANFTVLEQAFNDKTPVTGKITDIVKGGLIANIMGCRAFVPSSQISARFEQNLEVFKGKEFNFELLEFDRSKRPARVVAGRKDLALKESEEAKNAVFSKLEIGGTITGTVSRLADFGAFIDLGGVDGLIHVSEVSWKRIRKPSDVLKVGDTVTATVIGFDPEKGKISLSLKDAADNPWNNIEERYAIGTIVTGTVARLTNFGAFVTLEEGLDGLVHVSQIAMHRVTKPEDELSPGQEIQVYVVDIDLENKRISLSKREADLILNPPPEEDEYDEEPYDEEPAEEYEETPVPEESEE